MKDRRENNTEPLKDLIDRWLRAYQLEDKMKELDVLNAWSELMGKAVAARTKDIYIKNNVLYVSLDSSVMRDELFQGKSIIIQRVNDYAKKQLISDIWFE